MVCQFQMSIFSYCLEKKLLIKDENLVNSGNRNKIFCYIFKINQLDFKI